MAANEVWVDGGLVSGIDGDVQASIPFGVTPPGYCEFAAKG
jgi:hypothetical protein